MGVVFERTHFQQFLYWEVVVIFKKLIFNSFYIGRVWWSERTHFQQFLHCEAVVILKECILTVSTFGGCGDLQRINFNSFYIGRLWWS